MSSFLPSSFSLSFIAFIILICLLAFNRFPTQLFTIFLLVDSTFAFTFILSFWFIFVFIIAQYTFGYSTIFYLPISPVLYSLDFRFIITSFVLLFLVSFRIYCVFVYLLIPLRFTIIFCLYLFSVSFTISLLSAISFYSNRLERITILVTVKGGALDSAIVLLFFSFLHYLFTAPAYFLLFSFCYSMSSIISFYSQLFWFSVRGKTSPSSGSKSET